MSRMTSSAIKATAAIAIGWGGLSTPAFCQEQHADGHDHHEPGGMEMGLSLGYAYLKEEKDSGLNLHLHVMKRLSGEGLEKYFSVGLGVETIFSNEKHYATMVSLAVHPLKNLVLSISPGVAWARHEGEWESEYATHLEASYVFEGSDFHYGPVLGYSRTRDEQHYNVGVHFGMPF